MCASFKVANMLSRRTRDVSKFPTLGAGVRLLLLEWPWSNSKWGVTREQEEEGQTGCLFKTFARISNVHTLLSVFDLVASATRVTTCHDLIGYLSPTSLEFVFYMYIAQLSHVSRKSAPNMNMWYIIHVHTCTCTWYTCTCTCTFIHIPTSWRLV